MMKKLGGKGVVCMIRMAVILVERGGLLSEYGLRFQNLCITRADAWLQSLEGIFKTPQQ